MKQFFGAFFGSIIGIVVAVIIAVVLLVAAVKSSINSAFKDGRGDVSFVNGKSVLQMDLEGTLEEREKENPFRELGNMGPFSAAANLGLNTMVRKLGEASKDKEIKGLYLKIKKLNAGFASLQELRDALQQFRESGKFIYVYAEDLSEKDLFLTSMADRIFLNPQGSVDWKGLSMHLMFFKNTFEKLDLEMQVFRHGRFKSAVEPILFDKMSESNRLQAETYLNSLWQNMLSQIATDRKITVDELNHLANELKIVYPENAAGKLVDELAYEDEVSDRIKQKIGLKKSDNVKFADFSEYNKLSDIKLKKDRVAVIYAVGSIGSGEGNDEEIGSDRLARTIREARMDEKVKAIVLRVNSPGGSALASDVIWREMVLARLTKPTVVSMGDLAASGGYYISCGADRIFAQPNTITGSIGVFGVVPNLQKMLASKLGITVDTVNTNKYSDMGALRKLTQKEVDFVQASVERVYDTFTGKVAEGRKMSQQQVDSLGQGRVWSGSDAKRIQLVDELGGLQQAVAYAAKKAGIKEYKILELPRQKNPFDNLLGKKESEFESRLMQNDLGKLYQYFKQGNTLLSLEGVQARLPFELVFNP